jgi:phospholipid transport system substrate-binding protein
MAAVPAFASPAQDQLKASIDQILTVLKNPEYKGESAKEKRRLVLRTIINERFSFKKMSQLSMGKYWKKINDQQKDEFVDLFGQLLEQNYVAKIEAYTDEEILYTKELVRKNKAKINTKIVADDVEIPIDYSMYQTKEGPWMVYDMVIEGVSLVANYRSQFNQILQNDPYEKLVEELKKKLDS